MKRASDNILEKLNGLKKAVFLSKEERQKLAIQRRQEEAAQQKRLQTNNGPPVSSADTWRDMNSLCEGFRAGMEQAAKSEETRGEADVQKQKEQTNATLHWSEKMLDEMTERDWRMLGLELNISYKEGCRIPRPMRSWEESRLGPELIKAVDRAGYNAPTPIQMAAIPLGLHQRDFLGIAETCSGQTAAFVLPMLTYITRLPPINDLNKSDGPYAVVIAPSLKLVQKIEDETVKFAHYLGIKVVSIVGRMSEEEKKFKFGMGCEVVITTPVSLFGCLEGGYAALNQCNYVVLYYADRLIGSVSKPRLVRILDAMPTSNMKPENEDEEIDDKKIYRTTCMFSATMPCDVKWLATKYLRNPVVVNIGTAEKATKLITQHVIMTKERDKMDWLRRFLGELGDKTAFVFVNTSEVGDNVAKNLDKDGYRVTRLHEGKSQVFRTNRYNVFVATDVAGHGVDIPDVARVINYDMPGNIEAYARCIGRTGRAGKTGIAITFLTMHDTNIFYDLKQMLISSNSIVPSELERHEASKFRPPRRNDTVFAH